MRRSPTSWSSSLLARLGFRRKRSKHRHSDRYYMRRRPQLEPLEERAMLASDLYLVTTLADTVDANDGYTSLREAIALAASDDSTTDNDTIQLDASLFASGPATITLAYDGADSGTVPDELVIDSDLTIDGPGAGLLTIDGDDQVRVFRVASGVTAEIRGVTISGGAATSGGGIYNSGNVALDSAVVRDNSALDWGGGIYVANSGTLQLFDSTVDGNTSTGGTGNAGGLAINGNTGESLLISGSTISNNTASNSFGGFWFAGGSGTSTGKIINSTISHNTASWVGGFRLLWSTAHLDIINSTIAYNSGQSAGGFDFNQGGSVTLHNTIIAENTSAQYDNIYVGVGTIDASSSNNLVGPDGQGGLNPSLGNILLTSGQTAGLAPLDYYGGPTKTHALLASSPAIDKGSDAEALDANIQPLTVDQRGFTRPVDVGSTGPTGQTVDIGAYELNIPSSLVVTTLDDEDDGNYDTGDLSLREALALASLTTGTDTITFDDSLFSNAPATITLTYDGSVAGTVPDQLTASNVNIQGPGADKLIISGGNQTRVFYGSNVTIDGATVTGGYAGAGGGIYGSYIEVRNSRITGNTSNSRGGGIFARGLQLIASEVSDNTATDGGGGIFSYRWMSSYPVTIENSTISGNRVTGGSGRGGGIYSYLYYDYGTRKDFTITNSTISGNSAADGGGLFFNQYSIYNSPLSIKVHNTIIAGNVDLAAAPDDVAGASNQTLESTSSFNLFGEGGSGGLADSTNGNMIVAVEQAGLQPLDFYGGTTRTQILKASSMAVDHGDDSVVVMPDCDQRGEGFNRVVAAIEGNAPVLDIGAAERATLSQAAFAAAATNDPTPETIVVTLAGDEVNNNSSDDDLTLREALARAKDHDGPDTIEFAPAITQILLDAPILIDHDVTIVGNGAKEFAIDAQHKGRLFTIGYTGDLFTGTLQGVSVTIQDATLTGGSGGAILQGAFSGDLTLDRVIVTGNEGTSSPQGSIIYGNNMTSLIARDSTFYGNTGGTVIDVEGSSVDLANVTISANTSPNAVGALYVGTVSHAQLTNVTIKDNKADIDGDSSNNNGASSRVGGILIGPYAPGAVTMTNSIVAGNTYGPTGAEHHFDVSTFSANVFSSFDDSSTNNLIGLASTGIAGLSEENNLIGHNGATIDPMLTPLGDYGGPTPTHALMVGSQAIGGGSVAFAPSLDQRGFARDPSPDIGSFEFAAPIVVSTLVDEDDGNYGAGDLSLREALILAALSPGSDAITFASDARGILQLSSALTYGSPDGVFNPGDVTIEGPGAADLTIDANGASSVFVHSSQSGGTANPWHRVTMSGLSLTGASGAAIQIGGATFAELTLDSVEIFGNGAGVIHEYSQELVIANSTIADNAGTAVRFAFGGSAHPAKIYNTTISGNHTSGAVAGVSIAFAAATLANVTITNNRADEHNSTGNSTGTGGVYAGGLSTVKLDNTIVIGNLAGAAGANQVVADLQRDTSYIPGSLSGAYNLIGSVGYSGLTGINGNQVGKTVAEAALAPLDFYGGPTRTHALLSGSPAIDLADDALAPEFDQRGIARWDNRRIVNSVADIGAFEYAPTLVVTTLDDEPGSGTTNKLSLREAIQQAAPGDIIGFDPTLDPTADGIAPIIELSALGDLVVNKSLDIDASSLPDGLTIRAYDQLENDPSTPEQELVRLHNANGSRVFLIQGNDTDVTLRWMTLTGGDSWDSGGAIRALGHSLTLEHVEISHNAAPRAAGYEILGYEEVFDEDDHISHVPICGDWISGALGGGVYSAGDLIIRDSQFVNNATNDFAVIPNRDQFYCSGEQGSAITKGEVYSGDVFSLGNLTIERSHFETVTYTDATTGVPDNDNRLALGGIYATNWRNADADVVIRDTDFVHTRGLVVDSAKVSDGPVINTDYVLGTIDYQVRNVRGGNLIVPAEQGGEFTIPGGPQFPIVRISNKQLGDTRFEFVTPLPNQEAEQPSFEIRQVLGEGKFGDWTTVTVTVLDPDTEPTGDEMFWVYRDLYDGNGLVIYDAINRQSLSTLKDVVAAADKGVHATLTNVTIVDPRWGMVLRYRPEWDIQHDEIDNEIPQDLTSYLGARTDPKRSFLEARSSIRVYHADATLDGLTLHQGPRQTGLVFPMIGVFVTGSETAITNSRFLPAKEVGPLNDNQANGPAVLAYSSQLAIRDSIVQEWNVGTAGISIAASNVIAVDLTSDVEISGTTFFNNSAANSVVRAEPVFPYEHDETPVRFGGRLVIRDSVFRGNATNPTSVAEPAGTIGVLIPIQPTRYCDPNDPSCPLPDPTPTQVGNRIPYRLIIEGSTISDNVVSYNGTPERASGGGVYLNGPVDAFIVDSTISNNRVGSPIIDGVQSGSYEGYGGGISAISAHSLRVENSTISENVARDAGGGIFAYDTDIVELTNVTMMDNVAGIQGGGLFIVGGTTAAEGGFFGIWWDQPFVPLDDEVVTLVNTIIADNRALGLGNQDDIYFADHQRPVANGGPGIFAVNYENTQDVWFAATNSVVPSPFDPTTYHSLSAESANNIIGVGVDPTLGGEYGTDPPLPIQNNVHGNRIGTWDVNGALKIDPKLTPLGDYGGQTETHGIRLGVGSPALNAGFETDLIKPVGAESASYYSDISTAYNLLSEAITLRETDPIVVGSGSDMDGRQWISPKLPEINGVPQPSPFIPRELTFGFATTEQLNKIVLWPGGGGASPTLVTIDFSINGGETWQNGFTGPLTLSWGSASASVSFANSVLANLDGFVSANAVRLTILANAAGTDGDGNAIEFRTALNEVRFGAEPRQDQRGEPFDRVVGQIDIGAYESPANWATLPDPQLVDGQLYSLVVNSTADVVDADVFGPAELSLREAILLSNLHNETQTIALPSTLGGGHIDLTRGELQISDGVTLAGTGGSRPTIDASSSYLALPNGEGQIGAMLPGPADIYGNQDTYLPMAAPGSRSVLGSRVIDIDDGVDSIPGGGNEIKVTLDNLDLTGGLVQGSGGAIRTTEDLTVENSVIHGNSAHEIYYNGKLSNEYSLVSRVPDAEAPSGGGIYSSSGDLIIRDTKIVGNSATTSGGGFHVINGTVEVVDSEISSNVVRRSIYAGNDSLSHEEHGGGVSIIDTTSAHIENSTICDNIALSADEVFLGPNGVRKEDYENSFGGGIYVRSSTLYVDGSTISGNEAREGGGIFVAGHYYDGEKSHAELHLANSTISENEARARLYEPGPTDYVATNGGGIAAVGDSDVYLHYSTVTANRVDTAQPSTGNSNGSEGGGVYFPHGNVPGDDPNAGRLVIDNSVVAGNTGPANFDPAIHHLEGLQGNIDDAFRESDIYFSGAAINQSQSGNDSFLKITYSLIGDNRGLFTTDVDGLPNGGYQQSPLVTSAAQGTPLPWSSGGVPMPDARGNLIGGALIGQVIHPVSQITKYYGGYLDPQLDILADNDGLTKTHAPLRVGSDLALLRPATVGYTLGEPSDGTYVPTQLIDNPIVGYGAPLPLTLPYRHNDLLLRQQIASTWQTVSAGGASGDYFDPANSNADPTFEFELGRQASPTEFITWAPQDVQNSNDAATEDEAKVFLLEFFDGAFDDTYKTGEFLVNDREQPTPFGLSRATAFGQAFTADRVRVTILDNFFGADPQIAGGDRVALGQIRFVGELLGPDANGRPSVISPLIDAGNPDFNTSNDPDGVGPLTNLPNDQRGAGYDRVTFGTRIDIGAYETRALPDGQYAVAVVPPNDIPPIPEDADTTGGIKITDIKVLYGKDLPYTFILTGDDSERFEVRGRELWLKNDTLLDHETNPILNVSVEVVDSSGEQGSSGEVVFPDILVDDRNDQPVLADAELQLTLSRDTTPENNAGLLLSTLLVGASDQDQNPLGITIIGTNSAGHGKIQYTTDGGVIWRNVGDVSSEAALLLAANPDTRVRFNATETFSGVIDDAITFYAWDQTVGTSGTRSSLADFGKAISEAADKVAAAVSPRVGEPISVNAAYTAGSQVHPAVAVDARGGSIYIWQDLGQGGTPGIFGQLLNSDGSIQGSQFVVSTSSTAVRPQVMAMSTGDFVVVWQESNRIYARKFRYDGVAVGSAVPLPTTSLGTGSDTPTSVAMTDDGSFFVTWYGYVSGQSNNVYVQKFTSDLGAAPNFSSPILVSASTAGNQVNGAVADSHDGSFYVAWVETSANYKVYLRRFAANGSPTAAAELIATVSPPDSGFNVSYLVYVVSPRVTAIPEGDVVVSWIATTHWEGYDEDGNSVSGEAADVSLKRKHISGGAEQWMSIVPLATSSSIYSDATGTTTGNDVFGFSQAADADGRLGTVWSTATDASQPGTSSNLITQWFDADGLPLGGPFSQSMSGRWFFPEMAANASGSFAVTAHADTDIYSQRYELDSLPTFVPLLRENGTLQLSPDSSEAKNLTLSIQSFAGADYIAVNGRPTTILASDVTGIVVDGGDGNDIIDLRQLTLPAGVSITVKGGAGNDTIYGTAGNDIIDAGAGDDKIYGGGGQDVIEGGIGDDTYYIDNRTVADIVLSDAGGTDTADFGDWLFDPANTDLGALLVRGYTGEQTISRAASSDRVTMQMTTGAEIDAVAGGSEHLFFRLEDKPTSTANNAIVLMVDDATDTLNLDASSGHLSLREALIWAKTDQKVDTITFAPQLVGETIYLADQDADADGLPDQLVIDSGVSIDGPSSGTLTISGAAGAAEPLASRRSRIFYVTPGAAATLKRLTLTKGSGSENGDAGDGGAILAKGGLTLDTVVITDNQATGASSVGGGVAFVGQGDGAKLQIIDSTISLNYAPKGAGINIDSADATIAGSTIHSNATDTTATEGGGLRQVGASTIDAVNSTFSGNSAYIGGGIYTSGDGNSLRLTNVTIAFNFGDTGGGLYGDVHSVLAHNTLLSDNMQLTQASPNDIGGTPFDSASAYNLVRDAGSAGGLDGQANKVGFDPELDSTLDFWGGPTPVLRILSSSSHARNSDYEFGPPIDQRGYVPDNNPTPPAQPDTKRDIGAFEYGGVEDTDPPTFPTNFSRTISEDVADGQFVVQVAASPNWRRFTYAIIGGTPQGLFAIDEHTGVITVANASLLDADLIPSYLLQVTATQQDGGSGSGGGGSPQVATGLARVNVSDRNEAPKFDEPTSFDVAQSAAVGTLVGFVAAVDPEHDTLHFTKLSGSNAFKVDPYTGEVFVADPTQLSGDGPLDLKVQVADSENTSTVDVTIHVIVGTGPTTPADLSAKSTVYEVSHRKQLSFNPIAGFENYTGKDIRVEFKLGGATKWVVEYSAGKAPKEVSESGEFGLGRLSLNANNGSLTYTPLPGLAKNNKLKVDNDYRYAASETISYEIFDLNDASSQLAKGNFSVKVTNDLPVFRGELQYDPSRHYALDTTIKVLHDTQYLVDLSDFFYDPDGDELQILGFTNEHPIRGRVPGTTDADDQATGIDEIWAIAALTEGFEQLKVRKVFLDKLSSDTIIIHHDGNQSDLNEGLSANNVGTVNFQVSVSDGQLSGGKPVAFDFEIDVTPELRDFQPQGPISPLIDVLKYTEPSGSSKIDESKWSVDAVARQPSREGRDLQLVGDTLVDLNSGTFVRRQELVLDGSGGESEYSLPGLTYDSATVGPRPVIQVTVNKPVTNFDANTYNRTSIEATFRWVDHVNTASSKPLPQITGPISYTLSRSDFNKATELSFAFQPPDSPRYTGVYHWEVDFTITVAGSSGDDEVLTLTQHGETPVVVQERVDTGQFGEFSPALWNYTPAFGNGWALEGVPQLFVDDLFAGPQDDYSYANDRLILYFPGEAPRVFRPNDEMHAGVGFDRQMYGEGLFTPIDVASRLDDPHEWGSLKATDNGNKIVYTSRDNVQYFFERVAGVAQNSADNPAPAWRIYRIYAPGVLNPIKFQYDATNRLRITDIICTDGTTTHLNGGSGYVTGIDLRFDGANDYTLATTGDKLTRITLENNAPATDRVRTFTYEASSSRMASDNWYSDSISPDNLRRTTNFDYDSTYKYLSKVTLGSSPGTTVYTLTPAFKDVLGVLKVNPTRTATVTLTTNIETLTEGSAPSGRAWVTKYQFDGRGHIVKREETFRPSSGSAATQLSVERWTYDQFGSVKSHEDKHLRSSSVKDDVLIGRMTYFTYDYQTPPTYNSSSQDQPNRNDPTPIYDPDDYRGNVIRIDTFAGSTLFEYETDDETISALGRLMKSTDVHGTVTTYERNLDGQTTKLTVKRKDGSDYFETWDYFDSTNSSLQGLLRQHVSPLGLVTTYDYYYTTSTSQPDSRRLKSVTTTDAGTGNQDDGATGEYTFTFYVYDQSNGYGYLNTVTTYSGSSALAENTLSLTDYEFDSTGLLQEVTVKSPSGATLSQQQYDYDPDGLRTKVTDGLDSITTYTYDKRGLLTDVKLADGANYTPHVDGLDSIAQHTQYTYYTDGSLKLTILPDNTHVNQYYDPAHRIQWTETENVATSTTLNGTSGDITSSTTSQVVRTDYDVLGRTTAETNLPTGAVTKYEYGDIRLDAPTRISERVNLGTTSLGNGYTITDDDAANLVPDDAVTSLAYDQRGNVIFEQAPGQAARSMVFDELGYVKSTKVLAKYGAEILYETDALGNVTKQTEKRKDASGAVADVVTDFRYDQQGRLRRIVDKADADGATNPSTTAYDYAFEHLDPEVRFAELPDSDTVRSVTTTTREGLTTKQFFDAAGQLVRENNSLGGTTTNQYDAAGNLTHTRFTPASADDMTNGSPLPSRHTTFEYDKLNRLRKTTYVGSTSSFSTYVDYFLPGQITGNWDVVTTDANDGVTKSMVDSLGNPIAIQLDDPGADATGSPSPEGAAPVTLYSYSYVAAQLAYAVTTRVTSKRGENDIAQHSDPTDRLLDDTHVSRQVLNTRGQVLVAADRVSGLAASATGSDAVADTSDFIDDGFQVRQLAKYGVSGQLSVSTDGEGNHTWYAYDNALTGTGLATQVRSPNGEWVVYEYDSAGNRLSLRQVRGQRDDLIVGNANDEHDDLPDNITAWEYDDLGRVTKETVTSDEIGPSGIPEGETETFSRRWAYYGLTTIYGDRRDTTNDPLPGPAGPFGDYQTKTTFDPAMRKQTETAHMPGTTYTGTTILHSDGSVKQISDNWSSAGIRNGDTSTIDFTYDEFGRTLSETENFDLLGATPSGLGFLSSGFVHSMTYFDTGVRQTGTWSLDGTAVLTNTYHIDKLNRVDGVSQEIVIDANAPWAGSLPSDKSIAVLYNSDGSRHQVLRFNVEGYGLAGPTPYVSHSEYGYAADGRLESLSHFREDFSVKPIAHYINEYDANGRLAVTLTEFFDSQNSNPAKLYSTNVACHYDQNGQLIDSGPTSDTAPEDLQAINGGDFRRDDGGNRNDGALIGRQNRLLIDPLYSYKFDEEGNVIERRSNTETSKYTAYTWDLRGRLLSAVNRDGEVELSRIEFFYDALNRRVAEKYTNIATPAENYFHGFAYDGNNIVFETDLNDSGKIIRNFVYGPGTNEVVAIDQGATTVWQFADLTGTVRTVGFGDSTNGWTIQHRNFDQFGNPIAFPQATIDGTTLESSEFRGDTDATLAAVPRIFAGHQLNRQLGYYDMRARWYDPASGRFLSEDPLGYAAGDANLYRYAAGDPVNNFNSRRASANDSDLSDADLTQIYGTGLWGGFKYYVGETARWAIGNDRLASASDWQLYAGTTVLSAGLVFGGYYGLAASGIVGTGGALANVGSAVTYASIGYSGSQYFFTLEGGTNFASDTASLALDIIAKKFSGPVQVSAYGLDFLLNVYQGSRSTVQSYEDFRHGNYVGGTLNAIGATLGFASAGARAGQLATLPPSQRASLGFGRRVAGTANIELQPARSRGLFTSEGQAHHLNQSEVFGGVVPSAAGVTTPLRGDAFRDVGSPHFLAHRGMEAFFDVFRPATSSRAKYQIAEGWLVGSLPTFSQHNRALYNTLQAAGVPPHQALRMVIAAKAEQLQAGFRGRDLVLDLPRRFGQKGGP